MRFLFLFTVSLVILNPIRCRSSVNFPDLLITNQYLLVQQYGCLTQFEAGVQGICPTSSKKLSNVTQFCKTKQGNIHLIRDPEGIHPPKLAILLFSHQGLYLRIEKIDANNIWKDNQEHVYHSVEQKEEASHTYKFTTYRVFSSSVSSQQIYSLYDSSTQSIFIIDYSARTTSFEQLLVSNIFEGHLKIIPLIKATNVHENNNYRFGWTQDPYKETVYYKQANGEQTTVYELPMKKLLIALFEGYSGKAITTSDKKLESLSLVGGIRYERNDMINGMVKNVITTYRPLNTTLSSSGVQCNYDESLSSNVPSYFPFLVIRDDDYCLVRYGKETLEKCREEREEWLNSKGLIYEQEDPIKWLVITIIILVMIVVLLLVYVYWLRSTFVADEEHTRQEYENNEASLFVAKQRSFPSVYPDPALLDVSVDKWN